MKDDRKTDDFRASVDQHIIGNSAEVREIYDKLLTASRVFGPVCEDPKKTSIHLVSRFAFAGIQTRRNSLVLTLKSSEEIDDDRYFRRQRASANRWYLETKLTSANEVDA